MIHLLSNLIFRVPHPTSDQAPQLMKLASGMDLKFSTDILKGPLIMFYLLKYFSREQVNSTEAVTKITNWTEPVLRGRLLLTMRRLYLCIAVYKPLACCLLSFVPSNVTTIWFRWKASL